MSDIALSELVDQATRALERRGGVLREGSELRFRCFFPAKHRNGDANPSAYFNAAKGAWLCRVCGARGGVNALLFNLGEWGALRRPAAPQPPPADCTTQTLFAGQVNGRVLQRETGRWSLRDAGRRMVAEHVRLEPGREGRPKEYPWFHPDGRTPGLPDALKPNALPLYGVDKLFNVPHGSSVVLVEGEKARDALTQRGVLAVGTVTGAGGTPTDDVLRVLGGYDVTLWADADMPGRRHMQRIAARLTELGISHRLVDPWPEATDGRDAADWSDGTDELRQRLQTLAATAPTIGKETARIELIYARQIEPRPVRWAWKDRVPLGMVTLLVGDPGLGKSQITIDLLAQASRGTLEGDLYGVPAAGCLASAEDAREAVVKPRLLAAGADQDGVCLVAMRRGDVLDGVAIPDDLPALRTVLAETKVKVLVVDPLVAHLNGQIDSHKDMGVRRALAPLATLASDLDLAVVCVMHLSKAQVEQVLYRVGGSIGFVAAARSVLVLGADPDADGDDDGGLRVLAHAKCNVGPLAPSMRLRTETATVSGPCGDITVGRIRWLGEAKDVWAGGVLRPDREERSETQEAVDFLEQAFSTGAPRPAKSLSQEAKVAGIRSTKALRLARQQLRIKPFKASFDGPWMWPPPPKMPFGAQDAQGHGVGTLGGEGHLGGGPPPCSGDTTTGGTTGAGRAGPGGSEPPADTEAVERGML
jgi:putative DNA primase/helicase